MRISFCESNCAPFHCLRSLFCCHLPSFLSTKDAPNLAPVANSNSNPNSCANQLPLSDSVSVSESVDDKLRQGKVDALGVEEVNRKSCLKKLHGEKKGNVKWMDLLGKELAEIKEYEPSESESLDDDDGNAPCICSIQ